MNFINVITVVIHIYTLYMYCDLNIIILKQNMMRLTLLVI